MHQAVTEMPPSRPAPARPYVPHDEGFQDSCRHIPVAPMNHEPINRAMSVERVVGTQTAQVLLPPMKEPRIFKFTVKQYTKLPDHRPPLRRDKPVRISLPGSPPRYVYPALDRSFIFIPRAMRPNQRMRGKPRSWLGGSVSGFSRRTSVVGGGSYYGGSMYSPSIAMSRRSSIAPDMGIMSPTGSTISRPPLPGEGQRTVVVRLPPTVRPEQPLMPAPAAQGDGPTERPMAIGESSINDLPRPQTHPLPQKPTFSEPLPMHQPRPQKTVSVESIETPTMMMPFHHQVPPQVSNGFSQEPHNRNPSYPSHTTGTPLSQIPERAIYAAEFQPNTYSQPNFYNQGYPMMPPPQQGYYYPPPYGGAMAPSATAPAFIPGAQHTPTPSFNQPGSQGESGRMSTPGGQTAPGQNLVAQEVNGMVYYYDASQLPPVASYPSYPGPQGFVPSLVGMGGPVTPGPETGFYYPQTTPGMVYYAQ